YTRFPYTTLFRSSGGEPLDRQAPTRELPFDAHARRFTGDIDADGARGTREILPIAKRKRRKLGVRNDAVSSPAARAVETPLHTAVAGIYDENHGGSDSTFGSRRRVAAHPLTPTQAESRV